MRGLQLSKNGGFFIIPLHAFMSMPDDSDSDFVPPWKFGGFASEVETYGTSELKRRVVDHVLPEEWQSGDGHGRKVMHVVAVYLDAGELPDDEVRLRQARRTVAAELDVCERTIQRAITQRLYDDGVSKYRFLQDLREIEQLWKEHIDDAPSRAVS